MNTGTILLNRCANEYYLPLLNSIWSFASKFAKFLHNLKTLPLNADQCYSTARGGMLATGLKHCNESV